MQCKDVRKREDQGHCASSSKRRRLRAIVPQTVAPTEERVTSRVMRVGFRLTKSCWKLSAVQVFGEQMTIAPRQPAAPLAVDTHFVKCFNIIDRLATSIKLLKSPADLHVQESVPMATGLLHKLSNRPSSMYPLRTRAHNIEVEGTGSSPPGLPFLLAPPTQLTEHCC